ncbi:glycosyltransferase family 2 protein [Nodularia chucula]|uniref:glycosyltransferase family 2 protein n=1 Tax=Nodularia chucula TaxID=3093667 RepID=UPI0039C5B44E
MNSYFSDFLTQPEIETQFLPPQNMKVAIIIDTYRQLSSLNPLLQDICRLKLYQTKIDIYIVNNGSDHSNQANLAKFCFAHLQIITPDKQADEFGGFYYGLQFVSHLQYDYIWLLNDDLRLDPLALSILITTLQNHHEVGFVSSQLYQKKEPNTIQEFGNLINSQASYSCNYKMSINDDSINRKPYVKVEFCVVKSILLRHRVVQELGIFKDDFPHCDDIDLCLRVKQAGWVIAVNSNSIIWEKSPDLKLSQSLDSYNECDLYYWQKHKPDF